MFELLWLLLPVAAAAGWFAGRRGRQEAAHQRDNEWTHATSYHRDLHLLLTDRESSLQASASPAFDSLGDIDRDTAETHLALGNLFRRRGDVERAIRVHDSLIAREELDDSLRADARLELARDYDSAGLMGRSESQFRALLDDNHHVEICYENLLTIFERARDWQRAIEVANECEARCGKDLGSRSAHYCCELAESAEAQADPKAADYLADAFKRDPHSARANMLAAKWAMQESNFKAVIARYEQVEKDRPELLPEIIAPLFAALEQVDDGQRLRSYIERIRGRLNAYSVIKTTRQKIEVLDGAAAADEFFKDQIIKRPSLKGLRDWARGQLERSKPGEQGKIGVMCDMLDQVVEDKPGYLCDVCGFRAQTLHWRCPGCSSWDSVRTVIGAEGE